MPQQCSAETEKSSWRARRAEGPAADVPLATLSAREVERSNISTYQQETSRLRKAIVQTGSETKLPERDRAAKIHTLKKQLKTMESKGLEARKRLGTAKDRLVGETICKEWVSANKEQKPRDIIYALEKPQPETLAAAGQGTPILPRPEYEKHSKKMAEMAQDYHNKLQSKGLDRNIDERENAIQNALNNLDAKLTEEQVKAVEKDLSWEDIDTALKLSKNGSSPGINGLTYEFWKSQADACKNDQKTEGSLAFDAVKLLTSAYCDIQNHGIDKTTKFAEGWMCPIYKKGDRNKIENYRPITLLNTDYKIFTKALAMKLAKVCPDVIHPDQAGFMPGRQILEQTRLIRMVVEYAEYTEHNGLLVALDQEKAYDKVAHDYLWRTLQKFGFHEKFIQTIRSLYENAETKVMINGHLSSPFKITRVRQGDPMSCLLFDLAIEPLAAAIRKSELRGIDGIAGVEDKIIANLFADDTTVFLAEDDDFEALQRILDSWCLASTAAFNLAKTQVLPIGSKEYRLRIIADRKNDPTRMEIPHYIHIAAEDEAIRILGAWYGNNLTEETAWPNQIEKIDRALSTWERSNPTMDGRKMIAQMVIGGMTQYLSQVQGMPKNVERKLNKRIRTFLWAEKKQSPINFEILLANKDEGGQEALDIKARNLAIEVMWLKSYFNLKSDRAIWAKIADAIMAHPKSTPATRTEQNVDPNVKTNMFMQSWKTKVSALPETVRRLIKTAKEVRVTLDGMNISQAVRRERPIWYHSDAKPRLRLLNNSRAAQCLRKNHKVRTVGQTENLAKNLDDPAHLPWDECECLHCMEADEKHGCKTPHSCFCKASEMLDALEPKWDPRYASHEDEEDPPNVEQEWSEVNTSITTYGSVGDAIRILARASKVTQPNEVIHRMECTPDEVQVIATVASAARNQGEEEACSATGIIMEMPGCSQKLQYKTPARFGTNEQAAEMYGIIKAVEQADPINL
ncbi:hypothetical protein D9757_015526 [Collybiopsis confluens]|uniref:Reverse transcriptase domain-containing protein n=1 Tax=Collybiopsis confluens TaxID=2823264 RepID=A0A8H5CK87_9AGAR|nr:hypothetical protein D9757_015526 [Collybiopsis confluens]